VHNKAWFVDSSVILRAIIDGSVAVGSWFNTRLVNGDRLVGSQLLELEVRRVVLNYELRTGDISLNSQVSAYLGKFDLMRVTEKVIKSAAKLREPLRSADAIHLASALIWGTQNVEIVTHDLQMATAAINLGFVVTDPVTDDPRRQPVA